MEGRLFWLKTALRTVRYCAEGCFGNRNEIINCFVSDRQFLLSASYHKPQRPSTAFYGNSAPASRMRIFYLHFLHSPSPFPLRLFRAPTLYPEKSDLFRPLATTISQGHPGRKIIFSHRNILVIFPSIRKSRTPPIRETSCFIIFTSCKNYLFLRLKKAFLPRNCATSSPSSSSMRSS